MSSICRESILPGKRFLFPARISIALILERDISIKEKDETEEKKEGNE